MANVEKQLPEQVRKDRRSKSFVRASRREEKENCSSRVSTKKGREDKKLKR